MERHIKKIFEGKTVWAAILGAATTGLFAFMLQIPACSRVYKDNRSLKAEMRVQDKEIERLQLELVPFRTKALDLYGSADKESMGKLSALVRQIHENITCIQGAVNSISEKTAFIHSLPDGRTVTGDFISGEPHVLMDLHASAIESYNVRNFTNALARALECIEKHEASQQVARHKTGISSSAWNHYASDMYALVAEYYMSVADYRQSLHWISRANGCATSVRNDTLLTMVFFLDEDLVSAGKTMTRYLKGAQAERDAYFGELYKRGYLVPSEFNEHSSKEIKEAFYLSVEPAGPPAFCIMSSRTSNTNAAFAVLRWQGMGTITPVYAKAGAALWPKLLLDSGIKQ